MLVLQGKSKAGADAAPPLTAIQYDMVLDSYASHGIVSEADRSRLFALAAVSELESA